MFASVRRKLTDYEDPKSLGSRLRARRSGPIRTLIEDSFRRRGACRILDVGGTLVYWNIISSDYLRKHGVRIVLLNLKAVSIDPAVADIFESVAGNACDMPQYSAGCFDIVHANSVIEHVGLWREMRSMADEVRRIGKAYYIQTPNFWFPVEPHYLFPLLHWMPLPWRVSLSMHFAMGTWPRSDSVDVAVAAQQAAILLDTKMLKSLFPDARHGKERVLALPKSLVAVRPESA